ncbi:MAG TPA: NADH-quinone oxidoreductase subunit C [Candidatus Hydrogenedentes bacterium]|nr:NADH-quinone oxidoreductase subunit C [Candidatus Hydrogenedentota bacterium]
MTRDDVLKELRERFGPDTIDVFDKSPKRVYIEIRPDALVKMGTYIFRNLGARFHIATAVDTRDHLEILYHFIIEDINLLISLRVKLDRDHPAIDTLANSFPAANWIEREMGELLGIEFRGHPDPRRLVLPEQWPERVYPLRRDYTEWDKEAIRDRGV